MAPLTLSVVGRVVLPSSVFRGRPPNLPATTLIKTIIAEIREAENETSFFPKQTHEKSTPNHKRHRENVYKPIAN